MDWAERVATLIVQSGYMGAVAWRMTEVFRQWMDPRSKWFAVVVLAVSYGIVRVSGVDLLKNAGLDFGAASLLANTLLVAGSSAGVNDLANIFKRLGDKK